MIRRSRDAKFVIYQVLYIFVITVLALKGAEINLGEVVDKENVVEKSVRDSLINVVDSLSNLGLKFNIEIDKNVVVENEKLKNKLNNLNSQLASLTRKVSAPVIDKSTLVKKKDKNLLPLPFSKNLTFLKYATNNVINKGNFNVVIYDDKNSSVIAEVKPLSKQEFELTDQDEVSLRFGEQIEKIKVMDNLPPEINIKKVTTKMDKSDIYVKELQRTTCYTVTISDERIKQIKVNHSGPITVNGPHKDKKGNLVYNVSLLLATNEDRFNDWVDRNEHLVDSEGRYKANFFFSALDSKSKQRVEVGESFYFTDFSK